MRAILLASLWLTCSLCSAQVTVTANLTDAIGTTYRTAYLHFQLVNCGQNVPVVTGSEAIVQDSFDLRPPTPGGTISASIIGNDQITCGGIASTNYVVTPMKDSSHPLRDGVAYVICSSTSTLSTCGNPVLGAFNLVTALPMTQVPPTPGLIQIYGNPTKTQTLDQPNGTEMNFQGTVNFCSATVLCGNGSPAGQITVNGGSPLTPPVNFQNGNGTTVTNPSGSNVQVNVTNTFPLNPLPGDIMRYNVNGDGLWDAVNYAQVSLGVVACVTNVSCSMGFLSQNAPAGCCSEGVAGQVPTAALPFSTTIYSAGAVASTSGVIGIQYLENGNTGSWFIRGFWRMRHQLAITLSTNNRYYWGLAVWGNGSTLGTNGTNVLGTTVFSTDTPNHTFVGWRASGGTDANYQAEVVQAGSSPTTVTVNSGVAIDGHFHVFDVTLDQANTNFNFYIDGNHVATIAASTIGFTPTNPVDVLSTLMFTGDNKNTATAVSLNFSRMTLDLR